jgi:hypothetical protein
MKTDDRGRGKAIPTIMIKMGNRKKTDQDNREKEQRKTLYDGGNIGNSQV